MEINLDELTYGELEMFEEVVGFIPVDDDGLANIPKMKMTTALAWIAARRGDPEVTLADVRNAPVGTYVITEEDSGNDNDAKQEGETE